MTLADSGIEWRGSVELTRSAYRVLDDGEVDPMEKEGMAGCVGSSVGLMSLILRCSKTRNNALTPKVTLKKRTNAYNFRHFRVGDFSEPGELHWDSTEGLAPRLLNSHGNPRGASQHKVHQRNLAIISLAADRAMSANDQACDPR